MTEGVARFWREIPHRYRLLGSKCDSCGRVFFPPRVLCPECRRKGNISREALSGKGKIYSYTIVKDGANGFERQVPYVIALIKLEEGPLVAGQIVDCSPDEVEVGKPVELVFRRVSEDGEEGIIYYGYKFRLAEEEN